VPETPREFEVSRRGLLDWIIRICAAITGIALVVPALVYIWPVPRSGPVKTREEVGGESGWGVWQARKVSVNSKPVLVIRTDKEFIAFSAVCTHLGCQVEFNAVKRDIECPCHAGLFDLEGKVIGGPPPRPLPRVNVSVAEGKVYVSA